MQPLRNFEGEADNQLERARRQFDLAQQLGCNKRLLCSNVNDNSSGEAAREVDDLLCWQNSPAGVEGQRNENVR